MPILSLCLIVRDEADMLPGFLETCHGLWDELCAVDTGSRDETVSLLAKAGARLERCEWTGDFAAARNRSLELAGGDWILFLDADERPTPELVREIRTLLADEQAGAATVVMSNELPHGRIREADLLRLFRRDPEIRFRHRIHEEVATSVQASLARTGRRLVHLGGRVHHLGYVREVAAARDKKTRDRDLLTACVHEDPRDWYSWYKLLELARFWDDRDLWRATARKVAPLVGRARLHGYRWAGEFLALAAQGAVDDPAGQLALLDRWSEVGDPSPELHLRRGTALEAKGDLVGASREFARCLELPVVLERSFARVRPRLGLCRVAAARGDLTAAAGHVAEALVDCPRDPEALLAGVSFAWLHGGCDAVEGFVADHTARHGGSQELDFAVGEHALGIGLWERAEAALRSAAGTPPSGRAALYLGQALLARGEARAAMVLCQDLMEALPEAALGVVTCALVVGEEIDVAIDLDQDAADRALRAWVAILWRSRRPASMTAFLDRMPVMADVFPWLPEYLARLTDRLRQTAAV